MTCKELEKRVKALEDSQQPPNKRYVTHSELITLLEGMKREVALLTALQNEQKQRTTIPIPKKENT